MKKLCFVVMPFGEGNEYPGEKRESLFVLNAIIKPAVNEAVEIFATKFGDQFVNHLDILRELEDVTSGNVTENIVRHIARSHVTIVDLTGRNPNVFFELGVRFALKRNGTILMVQDVSEIPFNVRNFRVVEYDPRYDGIEKAKNNLKKSILKTLEILAGPIPTTTDSLVFQSIDNLKVTGPDFFEESPQIEKVSWIEYWTRVEYIERQLNELLAVGAYEPDILIGISNGGLLLADTMLRLVYGNKVPFVCLWALRSNDDYFDNAVNNAVMTPNLLKNLCGNRDFKQDKIKILVMDDIVGTQRTFLQLVEYIQKMTTDLFDSIQIRFVFLYTPRQETLDALGNYLLSNDINIIRKHKRMDLETITSKSELPYRKSIHYGDITKSKKEDIIEPQ